MPKLQKDIRMQKVRGSLNRTEQTEGTAVCPQLNLIIIGNYVQ